MDKCEYCGREEADILSKNDNKWYHMDCYIQLKTRGKFNQLSKHGSDTRILAWINCCVLIIVSFILYFFIIG